MTEKLYYQDSHLHSFTAAVTSCEKVKQGYAVCLDRSAFFPEGGGQRADTGTISTVKVLDVREKDGVQIHYTDRPLTVGEQYHCELDWEKRYRRMQNHSGEHIVSGITHALRGLENVGFHMGDEGMTIDFNEELSEEELRLIEQKANEAVRADLPVTCGFPSGKELQTMEYRSKLALTENVRIVEIEGIDRCACCAPHVSHTGEVGLIKLIEHSRHRGGTRITLVCGMDALDYVNELQRSVFAISRLLSSKRKETDRAVERLLSEQLRQKERIAALSMALVEKLSAVYPETTGNLCIFDSMLDEPALRELVNRLSEKCSGYAAAFSGSDETGYRYIIGSRQIDLREQGKSINIGIGGRGGGTAEMIQGQARKSEEEIRNYVELRSV